MSNERRVDSQDSFERQRSILRDLQARQAAALEASGTAAKARAILLEKAGYLDSSDEPRRPHRAPLASVLDTAHLAVGARVKQQDGDTIETLLIRFNTTEPMPPAGAPSEVSRFLTLGQVFANTTLPQGKFDANDMAVATGLLDTVRDEWDAGRLPSLSPDLMTVLDPHDDSFVYAQEFPHAAEHRPNH